MEIAPFEIFGKTKSPDSFKENLYFANSGFYVQGEGYLKPNFSEILRNITDRRRNRISIIGPLRDLILSEKFVFLRQVIKFLLKILSFPKAMSGSVNSICGY